MVTTKSVVIGYNKSGSQIAYCFVQFLYAPTRFQTEWQLPTYRAYYHLQRQTRSTQKDLFGWRCSRSRLYGLIVNNRGNKIAAATGDCGSSKKGRFSVVMWTIPMLAHLQTRKFEPYPNWSLEPIWFIFWSSRRCSMAEEQVVNDGTQISLICCRV